MTRFLKLTWRPLLAIVVVALFLLTIWFNGQSQYQKGVANTTAKFNETLAESDKTERKREQILQAEVDKLEKDAVNEREKTKHVIADMQSNADRLQQRAESLAESLAERLRANASTTSTSDGAIAAGWSLFGQCTKRYAEMGAVADRQRDDLAEWQKYGSVIEQSQK